MAPMKPFGQKQPIIYLTVRQLRPKPTLHGLKTKLSSRTMIFSEKNAKKKFLSHLSQSNKWPVSEPRTVHEGKWKQRSKALATFTGYASFPTLGCL